MTPKAQRIAIGLACDWSEPSGDYGSKIDRRIADPDNGYPACESRFDSETEWAVYWEADGNGSLLPDYINYLNAMHEAEKAVLGDDEQKWWEYRDKLIKVCDPLCNIIGAPADKRAEALLKTIGKWKDL